MGNILYFYKLSVTSEMSHFILRSAEPSSVNTSRQQTSLSETSPFQHHETSTYSIRTNSSTSASQGYPVFISTDHKINHRIEKVEKIQPKASSLLTTFKRRPKVKTQPKNVRWSEHIVTIVDDATYSAHRTCLLNLRTPDDSLKSAAVEAVLFMCDIDEGVSSSLIDMAWKIFWIKQNRYPSGSELYMAISDVNYDERKLVLEFIKECDTDKGIARIKSLLEDADDYNLSEKCDNSCLKKCIRQNNATALKTSCKLEHPSTETNYPPVSKKLSMQQITLANPG